MTADERLFPSASGSRLVAREGQPNQIALLYPPPERPLARAGELCGALTGEAAGDEVLTPEEEEQRDALKREYETQLAALDAEIAAPQKRVEKARAARDAAQ